MCAKQHPQNTVQLVSEIDQTAVGRDLALAAGTRDKHRCSADMGSGTSWMPPFTCLV